MGWSTEMDVRFCFCSSSWGGGGWVGDSGSQAHMLCFIVYCIVLYTQGRAWTNPEIVS